MEENMTNSTFQQCHVQDDDDTLSLRDLPIHDHGDQHHQSTTPRASTDLDLDLFQFFGDLTSQFKHSTSNNNIIFCGKVIPYDEDELNEYQKRDYLSVRSSSFHRSESSDALTTESDRFNRKKRSSSLRFPSSEVHQNRRSEPVAIRKVDITAITSMSAKSRRRMFMFGPVKFKPEMEMSAIRKRQGWRAPAPMFPVAEGGREVVSGGGRRKSGPWGLVRQLRCGAHLAHLLARSFACVSA